MYNLKILTKYYALIMYVFQYCLISQKHSDSLAKQSQRVQLNFK